MAEAIGAERVEPVRVLDTRHDKIIDHPEFVQSFRAALGVPGVDLRSVPFKARLQAGSLFCTGIIWCRADGRLRRWVAWGSREAERPHCGAFFRSRAQKSQRVLNIRFRGSPWDAEV